MFRNPTRAQRFPVAWMAGAVGGWRGPGHNGKPWLLEYDMSYLNTLEVELNIAISYHWVVVSNIFDFHPYLGK